MKEKETETKKKKSLKNGEIMKIFMLRIGQILGYTCITIGIIMAVLILTTYKF